MKSKLILSFVALSGLTLLPAAGFASSAAKNSNTTAQGEGPGEAAEGVTIGQSETHRSLQRLRVEVLSIQEVGSNLARHGLSSTP